MRRMRSQAQPSPPHQRSHPAPRPPEVCRLMSGKSGAHQSPALLGMCTWRTRGCSPSSASSPAKGVSKLTTHRSPSPIPRIWSGRLRGGVPFSDTAVAALPAGAVIHRKQLCFQGVEQSTGTAMPSVVELDAGRGDINGQDEQLIYEMAVQLQALQEPPVAEFRAGPTPVQPVVQADRQSHQTAVAISACRTRRRLASSGSCPARRITAVSLEHDRIGSSPLNVSPSLA